MSKTTDFKNEIVDMLNAIAIKLKVGTYDIQEPSGNYIEMVRLTINDLLDENESLENGIEEEKYYSSFNDYYTSG